MQIEHRYVWDVDGEIREIAPRGKIVPIGSDELEVWPWRCRDGHRCIQCYFTGKMRCAPRFWAHPEVLSARVLSLKSKAPVEFKAGILSLDKVLPFGEGTLYEYFAAQPVEPLNDGGFTEEITDRINSRASNLFRTPESCRIIDESCPKCGYQYSSLWGIRGGKQRYLCSRCGRHWTPSPYGIPRGMKEFTRKLRREGLSLNAVRRKVEEVYHKKTTKSSIRDWTRY